MHVRSELRAWLVATLDAATLPGIDAIVVEDPGARAMPGTVAVRVTDSEFPASASAFVDTIVELVEVEITYEVAAASTLLAIEAAEGAHAAAERALYAQQDNPSGWAPAAGLDELRQLGVAITTYEPGTERDVTLTASYAAECRRAGADPELPR